MEALIGLKSQQLTENHIYTLWQSNMAMENPPFVDDFPIETSIHRGFPIARFDYRRVPPSLIVEKSIFHISRYNWGALRSSSSN